MPSMIAKDNFQKPRSAVALSSLRAILRSLEERQSIRRPEDQNKGSNFIGPKEVVELNLAESRLLSSGQDIISPFHEKAIHSDRGG